MNSLLYRAKILVNEQYHIFDLRSLLATFESLNLIQFLKLAVVRNSNSEYFHSNALSLQNYIVVILQSYIVKDGEFKEEEIIAF